MKINDFLIERLSEFEDVGRKIGYVPSFHFTYEEREYFYMQSSDSFEEIDEESISRLELILKDFVDDFNEALKNKDLKKMYKNQYDISELCGILSKLKNEDYDSIRLLNGWG